MNFGIDEDTGKSTLLACSLDLKFAPRLIPGRANFRSITPAISERPQEGAGATLLGFFARPLVTVAKASPSDAICTLYG
jgi:hypothetical protein